MTILYADEFKKQFKKLPKGAQVLYRKQETLFIANWRDPRLHTKKLSGHPLSFSFRATRQYRILFSFMNGDTVLFATIGNRKDVYR
jgi:mRNA-degrading endonuclease RelE of RelBE toxin-antitoxin system